MRLSYTIILKVTSEDLHDCEIADFSLSTTSTFNNSCCKLHTVTHTHTFSWFVTTPSAAGHVVPLTSAVGRGGWNSRSEELAAVPLTGRSWPQAAVPSPVVVCSPASCPPERPTRRHSHYRQHRECIQCVRMLTGSPSLSTVSG